MSLKNWCDDGWLTGHKTNPQEIEDLLAVAERDLKDSSAASLSPDWQLAIAYNAALSYHIGMGLAKACAEILLKIPWLQHISKNPNVIISYNNLNLPPKINLYNTNKNPKAPDLLGFDVTQQPHVFEAKGYSSGMNFSALQHAINQVSQVIAIGQRSPHTRVACFYDMSGIPIHGRIIDPNAEDSDNSGITIKIDSLKFIFEYYSQFIIDQSWMDARTIEIFDRVFRIRALGVPDIYFGIDTKIHDSILDSKDPSENTKFFLKNYEQINNQIGQTDISVGLDGIILLEMKSSSMIKKLKKGSTDNNIRFIRFPRRIDL